MSDKVFLDSNVLVYSYSVTEPEKQNVARSLISEGNTYISTQVLQEVCNIVTRKFKFDYSIAAAVVSECSRNSNIHINTETSVLRACQIADRYLFSFYDSLIIAAALESDCTILYSEDMHDGQVIESKLTIKNPFK